MGRSIHLRALGAAAAVAFTAACQEAPTSPPEPLELAPAAPLFGKNGVPADGNGNKTVTTFDDHEVVHCGSGVILDVQLAGWMQTRLFGPDNRNVSITVFHQVITYTNRATGEVVLKATEVGPDRVYVDGNGDLVVALTGRVLTFDWIGRLIFNITESGELVFEAGRFIDLDAIACERLT